MLQCVILAGGLGTRMQPQTARVPKVLLPVAGRPFADWQLDWLSSQRVNRVVYSIGHLGSAIREHVGDGRRWGARVDYAEEGEKLLGTAGALRLAADVGLLEEAFFVLYGDSYISIDLASVEAHFRRGGLPALMTVYRNENQRGRSNVILRDGRVWLYDKYCSPIPKDMVYVDYGLSVFSRDLIDSEVAPGQPADLAAMTKKISQEGKLAGYEATEPYFEVGTPAGLAELERHLCSAPKSRQ